MFKNQEDSRVREIAEAKKLKEKELATDEIIFYGLWQTIEQVNHTIKILTK